jgi:phage/plasmid-associated DNA primase
LKKPPEVEASNREWREENDRLAPFLEERCGFDPSASIECGRLYRAYREWAEGEGENPITSNEMGRKLSARKIVREHTRRGDFYRGIYLRLAAEA